MQARKSICYHGFLGGPRSMGRVGQFLLDHLLSRGQYDVSFRPFETEYMHDSWDPRYHALIAKDGAQEPIDQQITFCSVLDARQERRAKFMSPWFFYELATLPRQLADAINTNDFAYACSKFVRDVFNASGVTIPVGVLGHGYDPAHFPYVKRQVGGKFIFLCIAEHTPRKNLANLVRAFEKAFQGRTDVLLALKLGLHGEGDLRASITQPDLVQLLFGNIPHESQLSQLYAAAHCFVLPTRGEGFGMPILEAMATGLPVIATNFSGHLDFCTADNAYLIDVRKMVLSDVNCFPHIPSEWAEPDEEHLIHLLRHVASNYDEALQVGRKAHASVKDSWTWEAQLSRAF